MGSRIGGTSASGSHLGRPVRRTGRRARRPVDAYLRTIAGSCLGLAATGHVWRSRSDRDAWRGAWLESEAAHRPVSGAGWPPAEAGCPALALSTRGGPRPRHGDAGLGPAGTPVWLLR